MSKIILRRIPKRPKQEAKGREIKVDADIYQRIDEIREETGIPAQRLVSLLLDNAFKDLIIEPEEV